MESGSKTKFPKQGGIRQIGDCVMYGKQTTSALRSMITQYFPQTANTLGWFYNQFDDDDQHLWFSERKSFDRIISATFTAISLFGLSESRWIVFPDAALRRGWSSSWRSLPKTVKWVQGASWEELKHLIQHEFFLFRKPNTCSGKYVPYMPGIRIDNYNIIDSTGQWVIVYGYYGGWYVFHRNVEMIKKLRLCIKKRKADE